MVRVLGETMKTIELTQGQVAMVDDAHYEWLLQWSWHASRGGVGVFYATATIYRPHLFPLGIRMHHILWKRVHGSIPQALQIDHRDGNGLNNQLSNLRLATPHLNSLNRYRRTRRKNGLPTGVYPQGGRYRAQFRSGGHLYSLGYFDSPQEAHAEHEMARREALQDELANIARLVGAAVGF